MKKMLVIAAVAALSFAACGKKSEPTTPTPPPAEGSAAPMEGSDATTPPADGTAPAEGMPADGAPAEGG